MIFIITLLLTILSRRIFIKFFKVIIFIKCFKWNERYPIYYWFLRKTVLGTTLQFLKVIPYHLRIFWQLCQIKGIRYLLIYTSTTLINGNLCIKLNWVKKLDYGQGKIINFQCLAGVPCLALFLGQYKGLTDCISCRKRW